MARTRSRPLAGRVTGFTLLRTTGDLSSACGAGRCRAQTCLGVMVSAWPRFSLINPQRSRNRSVVYGENLGTVFPRKLDTAPAFQRRFAAADPSVWSTQL